MLYVRIVLVMVMMMMNVRLYFLIYGAVGEACVDFV